MIYDELRAIAASKLSVAHLDDSLAEISVLLLEAAELASASQSAVESASYLVKITESEQSAAIRSSGEKTSEAQIASLIPSVPEVVNARSEMIAAAELSSRHQALVNALRERGRALHTLAQLVIAGYTSKDTAYSSARKTLAKGRVSE